MVTLRIEMINGTEIKMIKGTEMVSQHFAKIISTCMDQGQIYKDSKNIEFTNFINFKIIKYSRYYDFHDKFFFF